MGWRLETEILVGFRDGSWRLETDVLVGRNDVGWRSEPEVLIDAEISVGDRYIDWRQRPCLEPEILVGGEGLGWRRRSWLEVEILVGNRNPGGRQRVQAVFAFTRDMQPGHCTYTVCTVTQCHIRISLSTCEAPRSSLCAHRIVGPSRHYLQLTCVLETGTFSFFLLPQPIALRYLCR